jgi:hypothetical protein
MMGGIGVKKWPRPISALFREVRATKGVPQVSR